MPSNGRPLEKEEKTYRWTDHGSDESNRTYNSGGSEEQYLLGCDAVKSGRGSLTFRWKVLPPSSVSKSNQQANALFSPSPPCSYPCLYSYYFITLGLFFYPEDVSSTFFRNVGEHLSDYTMSHPRRQHTSGPITLWTKSFI
jgi:hypothetical protein